MSGIPAVPDDPREVAFAVALMMYAGEPCRLCGGVITRDDLSEAVFVGYAEDGPGRAAHGRCWEQTAVRWDWREQVPLEPLNALLSPFGVAVVHVETGSDEHEVHVIPTHTPAPALGPEPKPL